MPPERTWVITGDAAPRRGAQQLPELPADHIVGEPMRPRHRRVHRPGRRPDRPAGPGRDHARHAGRPRHRAGRRSSAGPSTPPSRWSRRASATRCITFGIPPDVPGHRLRLHPPRRARSPSGRASRVYRVQAFREKPDADVAEQFVASGEYYWNSGIFVWKAATILGELQRQQAGAARRRRAHRRRLGHAATATTCFRARVRDGSRRSASTTRSWRTRDARCWSAGAVPLGRRRQLAGPGAHATRRTPTATPCGARTSASRRTNCVIVADPGTLIATIGVEQPAHHPGRRRHPGRRPPRRGDGQADRRAAQEAGAGEVPVTRTAAARASTTARSASGWRSATPTGNRLAAGGPRAAAARSRTPRFSGGGRARADRSGWWSACRCTPSGREGEKAAEARAFGAWLGGGDRAAGRFRRRAVHDACRPSRPCGRPG